MAKTVSGWECGRGHVLGQVVRNGSGIRQLLLYRHAVDAHAAADLAMEEVDIIAVVEGYVMDVRCSICEGVRTWVPGEESLRRVIKEYMKTHQDS